MEREEYEKLKSEFLQTFANVPHPLRKEIIVVIDGDTFNWHTSKAEIMHDTGKAKLILKRLRDIGVI
ncbi:MAG: hypothetical protein U9M95_00400 [Candidatus Altiarchaeota archaeon]|nr:hypothetical protein [Candidatus Altiarchaeota archaeon]